MRGRVIVPVVVGLLAVATACGGSDSTATETPSATDAPAAEPESEPSDAPAPADAPDAPPVPDAPPAEEAPETTPPASPGDNGAAGTGTITVGDVTHELTITRCVAMAGAIGADAVSVSEPDNVSADFSFSPEDWQDRPASEGWTETGTVRLDSDDPYLQWESGASTFEFFNLPAGVSATDYDITSLDISDDGQSASGTANFVEINTLLGGTDTTPIPGSFAFTCPGS